MAHRMVTAVTIIDRFLKRRSKETIFNFLIENESDEGRKHAVGSLDKGKESFPTNMYSADKKKRQKGKKVRL